MLGPWTLLGHAGAAAYLRCRTRGCDVLDLQIGKKKSTVHEELHDGEKNLHVHPTGTKILLPIIQGRTAIIARTPQCWP